MGHAVVGWDEVDHGGWVGWIMQGWSGSGYLVQQVAVKVKSRLLGPMQTSASITMFINKLANVCK